MEKENKAIDTYTFTPTEFEILFEALDLMVHDYAENTLLTRKEQNLMIGKISLLEKKLNTN